MSTEAQQRYEDELTTSSQKKQVDFKEWLDNVDAEILDIQKGSFKESGTTVGGKIIIINKPL